MRQAQNLQDRLLQQIVVTDDGCWLWIGTLDPQGYGRINVKDVPMLAHRVAYTVFVGPIPDHNDIHHTCTQHACIAPTHLQPVHETKHKRMHTDAITHCIWGHEFTEANTYVNPKTGRRKCKACNARRERERRNQV